MAEEPKKLLSPHYMPDDEYNVEVVEVEDLEGAKHTRLIMNIPAERGLLELTQTKTPFAILVARADKELLALGMAEKFKTMVQSFALKLMGIKGQLSRGVRQAEIALAIEKQKIKTGRL